MPNPSHLDAITAIVSVFLPGKPFRTELRDAIVTLPGHLVFWHCDYPGQYAIDDFQRLILDNPDNVATIVRAYHTTFFPS